MEKTQPKRDLWTEGLVPYGYCQCGCGEKTEVWQTTERYRGRVKGEHKRFMHGHNGREFGKEYGVEEWREQCGAKLHRKNTKGLCVRCFCAVVGRSNAKSKQQCEQCGELCPRSNMRFCSWPCYRAGHEVPKGEAHWAWKGDGVSEWGARDRAQKELPSRPCEVCGRPNAHRHHIDRNILNNSSENIRFLCAAHHKQLHIREDGLTGAAGVKGPRGPQKKPRRKKRETQSHQA